MESGTDPGVSLPPPGVAEKGLPPNLSWSDIAAAALGFAMLGLLFLLLSTPVVSDWLGGH